MPKKSLILITAAAVALSLSACSSDPDAAPIPTSTVPASTNLDGIAIAGAFGVEPKITFTAPFAVTETITKVLQPGIGAKVPADAYIVANYMAWNATDGKEFDSTWQEPTPATPSPSPSPSVSANPSAASGSSSSPSPTPASSTPQSPAASSSTPASPSPSASPLPRFAVPVSLPLTKAIMPGLKKALEGQAVGSRVLFAVPPADGFAGGNTQAGIAATDTMIFVVDILQASLDAPSGKPGTETKWADTLKLKSSAEGVSLTIPDETAPKELVIETLIEGDGAKVASSDSIVTNYVGYSWTTKSVVEPWVKDGLKNDAAAVSSTLSGLQKALVGATVGSRILVIMPPADSWPEGSIEPKVEKGDTVVYVIDILFILK